MTIKNGAHIFWVILILSPCLCLAARTRMQGLYTGQNRRPRSQAQPRERHFSQALNPNGVRILNSFPNCGKGIDPALFPEWEKEAKIAAFPWLALLRFDGPEKHFQCTGTLITDRFILTSAQCVRHGNLNSVRLGEQNIDTDPDCERRKGLETCVRVEEFDVEWVRPHSEHLSKSQDIALIKLRQSVQFKEHIQPICLPHTNQTHDLNPNKFFIAGWGTTSEGFTSSVLRHANVHRQHPNACSRTYPHIPVSDLHICAQGESDFTYCSGDSGGPAFHVWHFQKKKEPRFIQYGIITDGLGRLRCKEERKPILLTNILQFLPWITENISN